MAGENLPLALRRTPRRGQQQHGVGEAAPRTPAPASRRKSSRASSAARKLPVATTKTTTMPRTAGKAARSNDKAGVLLDSATAAVAADDASDDSVTLVDDADDSITALDFDIPISSSRRSSSGASDNNNNKRKRRASVTTTPAIKRARRQQQTGNNTTTTSPSIVHILPLRTQILDDHIKRRIRRNGLSAEMNSCYGEKRARRQRTLAELRRARDELRDRDAEIERLRELTALFDQHSGDHSQHHHVEEMEMELSRLREEVMGRRRGGDDELMTSSPPVARGDDGWGVMGGGMSDGGSDAGGDLGHDFDDDEEFGERSLAELESGGTTPGQHRQQHQKPTAKRPAALHLHGPTLTPPSTSPTKLPSSPVRQIHSSGGGSSISTACDAGVQAAVAISGADASSQACIPDPQMDALHDELSTLRAEVSSLNDTLLERDALQARVSEKLAASPSAQLPTGKDQDQDVELQLDIVLQDLAEKTARLGELSSLLMPSSSPTTDKEATAQLASALQSVRGALADLDPSTHLPQTAAHLLSLTATRLRELDTTLKQRTADHDAKLAAATKDLAAARATAQEKETAAKNLSLDITHLAETINSLREELDTLQEHSASQQTDLNTARDAALQQKTAAAEAETQLADAFAKIATLSNKLSSREAALQVSEGEVENLRVKLAEAGVTIARLREGNAREVGRSREVVRAMRAQMMLALSVGEGFLGDESGGVAKEEDGEGVGSGGMDKAARGRSDDSGLGLDGELQLV